jgi:hypothetical protein
MPAAIGTGTKGHVIRRAPRLQLSISVREQRRDAIGKPRADKTSADIVRVSVSCPYQPSVRHNCAVHSLIGSACATPNICTCSNSTRPLTSPPQHCWLSSAPGADGYPDGLSALLNGHRDQTIGTSGRGISAITGRVRGNASPETSANVGWLPPMLLLSLALALDLERRRGCAGSRGRRPSPPGEAADRVPGGRGPDEPRPTGD